MQPIPSDQIKKRFQTLPETLQEAIFAEETADVTRKSCNLRDIQDEHVPTVAILAGRVLLGYLRPESFAFEIQKETGLDAMKAAQIAHDIDAEVFSMVRLELKKLYPPTVQTPTVERPGFGAPAATPQQPAPRYVVPIPEKFMKQAVPETKPEPPAKPAPIPPPAPITPQPAPTTPAAPQQPAPAPKNDAPEEKAKDFVPSAKPVIPLPTFIHSKFKPTEKKEGEADPNKK